MVSRYWDWPRRLAAAIEAARGRPFCWGTHDCALFAANAVLDMTGQDFAASFRGRYASKAEAAAILGVRGGLAAVVTNALGEPRAAPQLARRGDVVMVETAEGPALGICTGARAACAGPDGLTFVLMPGWVKAWEV